MADPTFRYSAFDGDGNTRDGTLQAISRDQAIEMLARQGLTVSEINEVNSTGSGAGNASVGSVSDEELASFAYEMSALLQAGVSLAPALELLVRDDQTTPMAVVTLALLRDVRAGTSFSSAIEKYPTVFPPVFSALVRAGEGTGGLDKALLQISEFLEKADEARNKIISALAYPVIVSGMAFSIITALFLFMVPRLHEIYSQIGVPIPAITALFLQIGQFADYAAAGLLGVAFFALPWLRHWSKTPKGRRAFDRWKLGFPVLGDVFQETSLASFNKTLSVLYESGVKLPQGVGLAAAASNNTEMESRFTQSVIALREGRSLSNSLAESNLFTLKMLGMIEAGEKSGNLGQMLAKMAEFAENRTTHKVERLMALLEPITIGLLGAMVGAAVLVLGAPLMSLSSSIQ